MLTVEDKAVSLSLFTEKAHERLLNFIIRCQRFNVNTFLCEFLSTPLSPIGGNSCVMSFINVFRDMDSEVDSSTKKAHRKRQAGSKADKKKKKDQIDDNLTAKQRNPKAFAFQSVNKVARQVRR